MTYTVLEEALNSTLSLTLRESFLGVQRGQLGMDF